MVLVGTPTAGKSRVDARADGAALSACVLLAGGIRPSPLTVASGLSVLDLELSDSCSVLCHVMSRLARLPWNAGSEAVVVHSGTVAAPSRDRAGFGAENGHRSASMGDMGEVGDAEGVRLRLVSDNGEYRGPAGAVRDACESLPEGAHVIVVEGARYFDGCNGGLEGLMASHVRCGASVTVGRDADGSPAGVYVLDRGALDLVPKVGFMDLKEQWLGRAREAGLEVRVHELAAGVGSVRLRTRGDLLRAAAMAGGSTEIDQPTGSSAPECEAADGSPGVMARGPGGGFVSRGAQVAPDAVLSGSVVMRGGVVGSGAVVVRSVVMPGGRVRDGEVLVDAMAGPGGVYSDGRAAGGGSSRGRRGRSWGVVFGGSG